MPQQSIERPFGITVFGSSTQRIEPDRAAAEISVVRVAPAAAKAFAATREGVVAVRTFLRRNHVGDDAVEVSRIGLGTAYEGYGPGAKFLGYRGTASFRVLVDRLDDVEAILVGAVEAGANHVASLTYHTTRLQELRDEARRLAIAAARRKAEVLATAAGARVGNVLHIEDLNPDVLMATRAHGEVAPAANAEEDISAGAFRSGSLIVAASVLVSFAMITAE
jgi:uncharacterized protein